jgi:hypothetical protein
VSLRFVLGLLIRSIVVTLDKRAPRAGLIRKVVSAASRDWLAVLREIEATYSLDKQLNTGGLRPNYRVLPRGLRAWNGL